MAKPNHGDITVETTPGFEGWNVTATLYLDPKKMVITEEQQQQIRDWLTKCLSKTIDHQLREPLFTIDMKISDQKIKYSCDTCRLPLACGIKVCKCPRKPHPLQCGVF